MFIFSKAKIQQAEAAVRSLYPNYTEGSAAFIEEVDAHLAEQVFTNPHYLNEIIEDKSNGARTLIDIIRDLVTRFTNAFKDRKQIPKKLIQAQSILAGAFEYIGNESVRGGLGIENEQTSMELNEENPAIQNGEIKYTLKHTQSMSWDEQIREYFLPKHGTLKSSDTLSLGSSGNTYSNFGMNDNIIGMGQYAINKSMREQRGSRSAHSLSQTNIENLGKGIAHPVAIVDNANRNCVYVVTGDISPDGTPVIAIISKNKEIDYAPAHEVLSAYGMDDFVQYIKEHIPQGSRIEVNDKTKLAELLLGNAVQFGKLDTILSEFANVIVNDNGANVNTSNDKSSDEAEEGGTKYSYDFIPADKVLSYTEVGEQMGMDDYLIGELKADLLTATDNSVNTQRITEIANKLAKSYKSTVGGKVLAKTMTEFAERALTEAYQSARGRWRRLILRCARQNKYISPQTVALSGEKR